MPDIDIRQKLRILDDIDRGKPIKEAAVELNITAPSIYYWKRNRDKLEEKLMEQDRIEMKVKGITENNSEQFKVMKQQHCVKQQPSQQFINNSTPPPMMNNTMFPPNNQFNMPMQPLNHNFMIPLNPNDNRPIYYPRQMNEYIEEVNMLFDEYKLISTIIFSKNYRTNCLIDLIENENREDVLQEVEEMNDISRLIYFTEMTERRKSIMNNLSKLKTKAPLFSVEFKTREEFFEIELKSLGFLVDLNNCQMMLILRKSEQRDKISYHTNSLIVDRDNLSKLYLARIKQLQELLKETKQ